MNKKRINQYIYILLIVVCMNNPLYSSKTIAYASDIISSNKLMLKELNDYTIDDSWTVIDTMDTASKSLDQVVNEYISGGKAKFYILDGNYEVNGSLNLNQPNIIIQGQSKENTKIIQNNINNSCINITADNVEIWSLNIDSSQGVIAVASKNSNNVKLENCIIKGSSTNPAVAFWGNAGGIDDVTDVETSNLSYGNVIEGNIIYSQLSSNEKDGVVFTKQKNGLVKNNNLNGSRIAFYLSRNSEVSYNIIENSETNGIRCAVPAYDNIISNNIIQNTLGSGICLVRNDAGITPSTYRASNINITNNSITTSRYFGIEISNLRDSNISNNTINKVDLDGIYLLYADNLNVKENDINDSGLSVVNGNMWGWNESLNSGIFIDYMVSNCILDSNKIDNEITTSLYGIKVQSGNNNINNSITNNSVLRKFLNGIVANEVGPESTIINTSTIQLEYLEVPPNIKTVATENSITVSWDTVPNSLGYEIEVCGNIIENGTSTSYDDTGLLSGINRNYRVRSKGGEWSNLIVVETLVPAPSNIVVLPGENDVKLSWDAEEEALGYEVEVDGNVVDNGTSTSYDNTGLLSGTSHNYRVRAKGGEWSNVITAETLAPPPPVIILAPSNIVVLSGENNVKLSWDAEAQALGYEVEVDGNVVDNGTSTSYDDTGLLSGTTHNYRVRVKGGEWSNVITAETLAPPPPVIILAPSNIVALPGENDVKLSWDVEEEALGYEVEVDGNVVDNGTSTSYDDTGLLSGTSHNYRVRAKGGEWSNVITSETLVLPPVIIPLAPSNIVALPGENDVKLSWDAEEEELEYEVEVDGNVIDNGTSTSYYNTGLLSGTTHNYRVRAKGGEWSNLIAVETLVPAPVIILAPSNLITSVISSQPQAILKPLVTVAETPIITLSQNSNAIVDDFSESKEIAENPNVKTGETNKTTKGKVKNKKYSEDKTKFNIINYIQQIGLIKIIIVNLIVFSSVAGIYIKFFRLSK
ncbi:right-handed parallel beta-helix repeat-containing protein [Clostridium felsineum]|uniref:Uncharacterized protein n=1 Tax=Clostridium felsineum TaxID=36839 RepID=A0A1S8L9G9_9CLOT|nr:right-handed parallel beta-helix repeat-containing protein [Clostridium felsineum]URZ05148.1 hypothetical protein CLROS_004720 [Clostridium felsineum]URZ10189.1 hypothetical protein CROST_008970 [Clostridium felsineum]